MKKKLCLMLAALSLLAFTSCSASVNTKEEALADSPAGTSAAAKSETYGTETNGTEASGTDDTVKEDIAEGSAGAEMPKMADAAVGDGDDDSAKRGLAESPTAEGDTGSMTLIDDTYVSTQEEVSLPEAGQLTAGEWNDNDNWGFFSNLCSAGKITFPSYGLDPRSRTTVTVQSADSKPIANASVKLTDPDGAVLWTAVTDHNGKAYLFTDKTPSAITVESGGKTQQYSYSDYITAAPDTSTAASPAAEQQQTKTTVQSGEAVLTFDGEGVKYTNTDIMFIVDTTGSMSDEMLFLQSEFSAIAQAVGDSGTRFAVNFYRDEGDDYITKNNDFTAETSTLQSLLNSETADGGGDLPEAVAQSLDESIHQSSWRQDSVKLAFLIFDAPPHAEDADKIVSAVSSAAAKGIRLIPVVSSNSDRDTELFGRALAIETGGTYVFLTDDSHIGGSHLEPIIGDYQVEKLYDLIIRVVNTYKS